MNADMLKRIEVYEAERKAVRRRRIISFASAFAAAAAIAIAAIFGYQFGGKSVEAQTFELLCSKGQKSELILPDGSVVYLNSSSSLSYSSNFNHRERNINLDGEAYFKVAPNAELPFVVHASGMDVTALGTEFNVKAYKEDMIVEATLVKGKILASTAVGNEVLTKNQRVRYEKNTGKMERVEDIQANHLVPWLANEVCFQSTALNEIGVMLERMYNVEVLFSDDEIKNYTYTGHIRNGSLKNILDLISTTSPVRYSLYDNIVKFSSKND